MNQNYEFQQNYQQTPATQKNASYFRAKAREALKNFYWYAVLAAFLVGLLGAGVSSGTFSFQLDSFGTDASIQQEITNVVNAFERGGLAEIFRVYAWLGFFLIFSGITAVLGFAFRMLVGSPVKLGYERYKLNLIDGDGKDLKVLFGYFKKGYGKSILLRVLRGLIDLALSVPLMIVTGALLVVNLGILTDVVNGQESTGDVAIFLIVFLVWLLVTVATVAVQIWVTYRYFFCYMIMAEYPEISPVDALRNSAQLMKGKKWKLFCLNLSFIGWILLASFCTCGIGAFFLTPYIDAANTAFYDDIANRNAAKDVSFPSLNPEDYDPNGQSF